jgi:hypothetical protein
MPFRFDLIIHPCLLNLEAPSPGKEAMSTTIHLDTNSSIKCALACMVAILLGGCRPSPPPQPSQIQLDPISADSRATTTSRPASEAGSEHASSRPEERSQTKDESSDQQLGHNGEAEEIHFDAVNDLTVRLPDGWKAVTLGPQDIQDRLRDFANSGGTAEAFLDATGSETGLLTAIYAGPLDVGRPRPTMTMTAVPRHGLRLKQYIDAVSAVLADESGVHVERAGLLYDVREDGTPVGIVMYRQSLPGERPEHTGYQLAQLDGEDEHLIVMSWIAHPDMIESLLPDIHSVAATVESQSATP